MHAKTTITAVALCAVVVGTTTYSVKTAHATGCESATSVTTDIWNKWGTVIKAAGCAGVAVASGGLSFDACYRTANKIDKIVQDMIAFWNKQAKNSWAKIGPRRLDFDVWLEGNIIGTTGRMFVSPYPATNKHVKIKVTKLDGKGKVGIAVCKVNSDKTRTKVADHTFNPGRDNIGHTWEYLIKGAKDDVITVHIDGKSVANSFKYKLRAKLMADENEPDDDEPHPTAAGQQPASATPAPPPHP